MIREARAGDVEALATLHAASLPSSLLTALGHRALVRYYTFVLQSPVEHAWVADDGRVIGGCVLSDAPSFLLERFARHAPLPFASAVARRLWNDRNLRRRVVDRIVRPPRADSGPYEPEVTQIFTEAAARGRGVGAELLRTCEAHLRGRGIPSYFVHTHRDDNAAGIAFYRREGFVTISEGTSFGDVFLVMQKEL